LALSISKAVVDLTRVDQIVALSLAQMQAIPLPAGQREARDRQRPALAAGASRAYC
jgi:hypothetical protein